jgi:hypothetical protein
VKHHGRRVLELTSHDDNCRYNTRKTFGLYPESRSTVRRAEALASNASSEQALKSKHIAMVVLLESNSSDNVI